MPPNSNSQGVLNAMSAAANLTTTTTTNGGHHYDTTNENNGHRYHHATPPRPQPQSILPRRQQPPKAKSPQTDALTSDPTTWHNSSLLSVTQITPSGLDLLHRTSLEMKNLVHYGPGGTDILKHKILATLFYEPSTRTSCSFQTAMQRLGGTMIHIDAGKSGNTSSSKKGESLNDTVRCVQCYTDVTVLRHPTKGSVGNVIDGGTMKPVINAGDGVGEHPTQALLDVFTIRDELGDWVTGTGTNDTLSSKDAPKTTLTVVMLGDLKHGRTVHSLAKLLCRCGWNIHLRLVYCSPPSLRMPDSVKRYVKEHGGGVDVEQVEVEELNDVIGQANVLYVTRVQKERFENEEEYEKVKGSYVVDAKVLSKAKPYPHMIVMHPLPRVDEISTDVDDDVRAAYFRQMENGMFVRMALLSLILGGGGGGKSKTPSSPTTTTVV